MNRFRHFGQHQNIRCSCSEVEVISLYLLLFTATGIRLVVGRSIKNGDGERSRASEFWIDAHRKVIGRLVFSCMRFSPRGPFRATSSRQRIPSHDLILCNIILLHHERAGLPKAALFPVNLVRSSKRPPWKSNL